MKRFIPLLIFSIAFSACAAPSVSLPPTQIPLATNTSPPSASATPTTEPTDPPKPTATNIPQKYSEQTELGPELDQFPEGIDPLTGLYASHLADLDTPAVLVSISNSPVTAKPQAGLSSASMVNEFFLGYGTTRYLAVFYGERPRRVAYKSGDCPTEPVTRAPEKFLGDRIWFDENEDGKQDDWEVGVPGVCLSLIDPSTDSIIAETGTTSNGHYFFDLTEQPIGKALTIKIEIPAKLRPTVANIGFEDQDSDLLVDANEVPVTVSNTRMDSYDIGLVSTEELNFTILPNDIAQFRTYVGPIRSGRLSYNDFSQLFPTGCLVFASAGADILPQLDPCELIFGEEGADSPNTSLLDIDHLRELSIRSDDPKVPVNYSGNLFSSAIPEGGRNAESVHQFFHQFSQARWDYDPISGAYLRYTDDLTGSGEFFPDVDRLTNRQLYFENVIYLLTDYSVYRHNQYDIELCCGLEGWAYLFRDGKMYKIRWSTNNREWEQKNGFSRPIKFIGDDKLPFPLKPGNTWVSLYTTNSSITEISDGAWSAFFAMPADLAPEN